MSSATPPRPASPLTTANQFVKRQPKPVLIGAGFVLVGLAALLDAALTLRGIAWPVYYALPILLLAWFAGWRPALAATVLSAVINFLIDLWAGPGVSGALWHHLAGLIFFAVVLALARALATVYMLIDYARRGDVWKAMNRPRRIGGRFITVPEWQRDTYTRLIDVQPSDIPILINAGKAFGTGAHQTTRMCVALLETYLRPGGQVFDIGCGTGILSLVAARLGAASVLAVDVEPEAVQATRDNAQLNEASGCIEIREGSLDLALDAPGGPRQFDVTVANLLAYILVDLLGQGLARTLAPDGVLILSGIRDEQAGEVAAALDKAGLEIVERRQHDEWVALAARRPSPR